MWFEKSEGKNKSVKTVFVDWSIRNDLIEIQRTIFRENEKKIKELLEPSEKFSKKEMEKYEEGYLESVKISYSPSNIKELKREIKKSDIVIVGDYHTLNQSQKTFLKLLKISGSKKIIIALEFFLAKFQNDAQKYLQDKISEKTFLHRIEYKKNWEYDIWQNFKPIFQYAKKNEIPVIGIDCMPPECETLYARDSFAAWRIIESLRRDPHRKIFVLIGETHTSPSHLPQTIKENLGKIGLEKKILVIHQNIEGIYFDLLNKGLEQDIEIVKLYDGRFCIINTPPIIVQQSFLNWLEFETETIEYSNLENNFKKITQHLCNFLNISIKEKLKNLTVYGHGDIAFLELIKKKVSDEEFDEFRKNIEKGESHYFPDENIVYLGTLSLNHAGEEASHFVKSSLGGYHEPRDPEDFFYSKVLHEAIGFFGSKVINPKRKAQHLSHFRKILKDEKCRAEEKKIAELVILHKKWERRKKWEPNFHKFNIDSNEIFYILYHKLGYILGELLYYGLLDGKFKRKEIKSLYEMNFEESGKAPELYLNLIKRLKNVKIPKRL